MNLKNLALGQTIIASDESDIGPVDFLVEDLHKILQPHGINFKFDPKFKTFTFEKGGKHCEMLFDGDAEHKGETAKYTLYAERGDDWGDRIDFEIDFGGKHGKITSLLDYLKHGMK